MDRSQDLQGHLRLAICAVVVTVSGAQSGLAQSNVRADFNGDGFSDLAIGVPGEDIGSVEDAGAVNVLYGSAGGFSAAGNQFWHQDSPGINDVAESFDNFGLSLAVGDFNGDGFADLAIGAPGRGSGNDQWCGRGEYLYGSGTGLSALGNQF